MDRISSPLLRLKTFVVVFREINVEFTLAHELMRKGGAKPKTAASGTDNKRN
jgi:hypothetical protein